MTAGLAPDPHVLAATEPRALLPARRAGEEERLVGPLRLVTTRALGEGLGVVLVADVTGQLVAAPVVRAGGALRRAVPGDGAAAALVRLLAAGPSAGTVALGAPPAPGDGAVERGIDADQTHDSVVVDETVVVKWAVHVEPAPGDPPAVATLTHLVEAGFTETPQPYGFMVAATPAGSVLLASAARYLPGATDGWDWYVDDLLASLADGLPGPVQPAADLGGLVARLHAALATAVPSCPDPVRAAGPDDVAGWAARGTASLDDALAATVGEPGERLRRNEPAVRAVLRTLAGGAGAAMAGTPVTRVHGDLHVGQVLRWNGGLAVSDLDGNPVLPAAERGHRQPPARDVAGMLRSLDHVGRIVDRRTDGRYRDEVAGWIDATRAAFLDAYAAQLAALGHAELLDRRLLRPFEVEQECRELVYAARHLPRWTYVPDAALGPLLGSSDGGQP